MRPSHPPTLRPGLIERGDVLEKLHSATEPVMSITAPAGYGKTTSMAQFHLRQTRPSAWLTLDPSDSDPVVLLDDLASVLQDAGLVDGEMEMVFRSESVLTRGVRTLADSIKTDQDGVLFLDQVDHLQSRESLDVVGALMTRIAGPLQLVTASRSGTGLPLGLLRSQGMLAELDTQHLAMDEDEARQVFESMGVGGEVDLGEILRVTEGWPAGIYLIALGMSTGVIDATDIMIRGDDFYFADYLREELLNQAQPDVREFVLRSSLLPRMSGPLCDSALTTTGSHDMLAGLEETNLLVVPLDRTGTWYRYHGLMEDFLRNEMTHRYPSEVAPIHTRAARWFDQNEFGELAIAQAQEANDLNLFVQLFLKHARRVASQGRLDVLIDWVDWLEGAEALADYGELAALAAYIRSMDGNPGGAEHMCSYAYHDRDGVAVDDDQLGPLALVMRSMQFQRGPENALADAQRAIDLLPTDSQWRHLGGIAEVSAVCALEGQEASEPYWIKVINWSRAIDGTPTISLALAQRALIALGRGDWSTAGEFNEQALAEISKVDFTGYLTSAMVFTVAARCARHAGSVDLAKTHLASAAQLRPRLSWAFPVLSVLILHEMAQAYVEIADMGGARRVMRDAADIIATRPKLGRLIANHEALQERLASMPAGTVGASSLTSAELRLLPMLVTHLSYPEVGERLFISRHTVKTQAMSIYRKLGVSSRSEAVEKAREMGLISF